MYMPARHSMGYHILRGQDRAAGPCVGVEGGSWYHVNALLRVTCVGVALPDVGLVLARFTGSTSPPPCGGWGGWVGTWNVVCA